MDFKIYFNNNLDLIKKSYIKFLNLIFLLKIYLKLFFINFIIIINLFIVLFL